MGLPIAHSFASLCVGALLSTSLVAAQTRGGGVSTPPTAAVPSTSSAPCVAWDVTPITPTSTLVIEGFLVAHVHAGGIEAFSAGARKWTPVAPPGATIISSGDWCLLMRDPVGTFFAYSARLNTMAPLPLPPTSFIAVATSHDDVACVVERSTSGAVTAWGYSAVWGTWVPTPLAFPPAAPSDFAISRFVVGVAGGGGLYHGFAARTGAWGVPFPSVPGALLRADGNTLLCDPTATGIMTIGAFSGVRGCWAPSPTILPATPIVLDHNVACVDADPSAPGLMIPVAYSAYRAAWFPSVLQPIGGVAVATDNIVHFGGLPAPLANQAFGAGHATWATSPAPNFPIVAEEDYMILMDSSFDAHAFSGLCGGTFVFESNPTGVFPAAIFGPDHIGGFDAGTSLHAFRPGHNVWAPPLAKAAGDTVVTSDVTIEVFSLATTSALSTRYSAWTTTPAFAPAPVGTGSVIAHQDPTGVVEIHDERCNMWNPTLALGSPHALLPGRNLVLAIPIPGVPGSVTAYSEQRCDWTAAGGYTLPAGPSAAEENVAYSVDSGGLIWAFGSSNDGHTYYQWPNGTEYLVSGPTTTPACSPTLLGYGVRSAPGNLSWMILGAPLICPPFALSGIKGELWLPLTSTVWAPVGTHDADCMVELRYPIAGSLIGCIQPWFQALTFDFTTFSFCFGCRRPDAAWLF